jgi:DNA-binding NarL/FixJ family response regulator
MRVLIADDHGLMRELLSLQLRSMSLDGPLEIVEAANYQEVLAFAKSEVKIDLVLMDYEMPGRSGIATVKAVTSVFAGTPVVIVSGSVDGHIARECLALGAAGFVSKAVSAKSFKNAIRVVLDGEIYVPEFAALASPQRPKETAAQSSTGGRRECHWTERERQVISLLIKGTTNKDIARKIDIGEMTAKTHVRNIYRKLGAQNRADAVRRVLEFQSDFVRI